MKKLETVIQMFCVILSCLTFSCTGIPVSERVPPDAGQAVRTRFPLIKAVGTNGNSMVYDVGKIWNGTFIRHVFVIENTGSRTLEIRDVIEGEGVRAAAFTREIPAAGKGEVVIEISTRRFSGKINKTALVIFEDSELYPVELAVTGEVMTSVEVSPDNTVRFRMDRGKVLSWHFMVTSPRKKDFSITEVDTFTPYLKSYFKPAVGDKNTGQGNMYDLEVTLSPDAPVGKFRDILKIRTDIPDGYPGEIFITGEIEGAIMYSPTHFKFTALEDGSFSPARISLSNRKGNSFRIVGIETDSTDIHWKETTLQDGRVHRIDFLWTGSPGQKLQNGKIVILTDIEEQKYIEIPYAVFPPVECGEKKEYKW